jgi:nicotinate-nucleotide adenylyltransferase
MRCIGIFGGTFDPIHYGHLRTAFEVREKLALDEVRFVPCGHPPHRKGPVTPSAIRLQMLKAALAPESGFVIDERELARPGPSYTVDTLASLRAELPGAALCLLLGMDAFLDLPTWHEWRKLLGLAHLVVAHRPGWQAPHEGTLGELIRSHRISDVRELRERVAGKILIEPVTQLEVSSTELRRSIRAGIEPRYLLPDSVWRIILATHCYATPHEEETTEVG